MTFLDLAWTAWLATSLTETTLLLLAIWVVDRATEYRLHPRVRHGLWTVVLIRLVLPPGVVSWPSSITASASPALGGALTPASDFLAAWGAAAAGTFTVWMAGSFFLAITWIWRTRRATARLQLACGHAFAALRRQVACLSAELDLRRVPEVFVDPLARAPYVCGLWRPRLVVPEGWEAWPDRRRRHAIVHELLHLRRRDLWSEAAWVAVVVLYWFHPLVHIARRRSHIARELCCDADAAARLGRGYRASLLEWVAWSGSASPASTAAD